MGLRTYQDTMKKYKENEDMRNRLAGTSGSTEPSEEELIADLANYATKVEPNVAKINQSVEKLTPNGNSPINSLEDLLTRYNSFKTGGQPLNMTPVNATTDVIPPVDTKPKTLDILKKVKELKNPTINNSKDLLPNKFVPTTEQDYQKVGDEGFEDLANPKLQPTEYDKPNAMAGEIDKNQIADAGLKSKVTDSPDTRDEDKVIPEAPAKPLTLEEQLEKAQQDKRWMDALALINRGFTTMGAGMGGGSVTQLKPDQTASEMLGKMGEERVQQAKDKITAAATQAKNAREELLKTYQMDKLKTEAELLKKKLANGEELTPYEKEKIRLAESGLSMSRERLDKGLRIEEQGNRTKLLEKGIQLLKSDPNYETNKQQEAAFDNMRSTIDLIKAGNQSALASLGVKMAKAMGEKGALSESDVTRYIKSTSWGRQLLEWGEKGAKGTLPPSTIKDIEANLDMLRDTASGELDKSYQAAASRLQLAFPDADQELVSGIIGMKSRNKGTETKGPEKSLNEFKQAKQANAATNEIRRQTKDGKIAIFDKNKNFLRYE